MKTWTFSLSQEMLGKKNLYEIARGGRMYIPDRVKDFIDDCIIELKNQKQKGFKTLSDEGIGIEIVFFNKRKGKDIDNQVCTLFDILQKAGIIENDKLIEEVKATRITNKKYGHCEFTIYYPPYPFTEGEDSEKDN